MTFVLNGLLPDDMTVPLEHFFAAYWTFHHSEPPMPDFWSLMDLFTLFSNGTDASIAAAA